MVCGGGELGRRDPISSGFAETQSLCLLASEAEAGCRCLFTLRWLASLLSCALGLRGIASFVLAGCWHWSREPREVGRGGLRSGVGPDTDAPVPGRLWNTCILEGLAGALLSLG